MRVEALALRGITRFDEPITLDLRELPPGLIAVTGENGAGKTTLMEAAIAALYRTFPSRKQGELVDYATRSDAFLEVQFELEGQATYRARVNIDGPHRKTDAVLVQRIDGRDRHLNDGKVSTFETAVEQILPRLDVLLASVVAAQNREGSFIRLKASARRALFAALLGADRYDAWSERAKQAAGLTVDAIARFSTMRDMVHRECSPEIEAELTQLATRLARDRADLEQRRATLATELAEAEQVLALYQQDASTYAAARARADHLELQLRDVVTASEQASDTMRALDVELDRERRFIETKTAQAIGYLDYQINVDRLDGELKRIDDTLAASLADIETRLANNRKVLEAADEIRIATETVARIEREQNETTTKTVAVTGAIASIRNDIAAIDRVIADGALIQQRLDRARQDAALLGGVPCGGEGAYAECAFLKGAIEGRHAIDGLVVDLQSSQLASHKKERLVTGLRTNEALLVDLNRRALELASQHQQARALAARSADLAVASERIKGHEERQKELRAKADEDRAAARDRETQRLTDLRLRRDETVTDGERQLLALKDRINARLAELVSEQQQRQATTVRLRAETAEVSATLDRTREASTRAEEQRAILSVRRREWDGSTAAWSRLENEEGTLERRRALFTTRRAELDQINGWLDALHTDVVEWQMLQRTFGKEGLQVIEIDEAGPTVSAYCNDLLRTCFGSRFSVDLVTQEAKATKGRDGSTMKEAFELKVFDSLRGGEPRDLADLSGGEQVLVDEALKSAIALLVNTKNQQPIRTCWRDETTGALDPENAQRYLDMLRRVQQLGGFHHVWFVSHNPDIAAQADAQLVVANGAVRLELPPYRRAEVAA